METATTNKLHPHKFALWIALGSIVMMFAGLTSAYLVKRGQTDWMYFKLPQVFWFSTVVIILSSITMWAAVSAIRGGWTRVYRVMITSTMLFGILFSLLQLQGFSYLNSHGVQLFGIGSHPSASFLGVITGLHIVHVLGGIVALIIVFGRSLIITRRKKANIAAVELVGIYWHFVGLLWIYLFLFFNQII